MGKAALLIDDLAQAGTIAASSFEITMPPSNLLTPSPSERWRGTAGQAWFVLDLLDSQPNDTVLVNGLTAGENSEFRVRLCSADPTGAAGDVADSGILLDGSEFCNLDYGTLCYLLDAPLACRYIRIDIYDPDASYVEAGVMLVGVREAFTYNFVPGGNIIWIDRSRLGRTSGGQMLTWADNNYRRVEFNLDWVTADQRYGLIERMHRVNGAHQNVLLLLDTASNDLARDAILGLITPAGVTYLHIFDEFGDVFGTQLRLEERL